MCRVIGRVLSSGPSPRSSAPGAHVEALERPCRSTTALFIRAVLSAPLRASRGDPSQSHPAVVVGTLLLHPDLPTDSGEALVATEGPGVTAAGWLWEGSPREARSGALSTARINKGFGLKQGRSKASTCAPGALDRGEGPGDRTRPTPTPHLRSVLPEHGANSTTRET